MVSAASGRNRDFDELLPSFCMVMALEASLMVKFHFRNTLSRLFLHSLSGIVKKETGNLPLVSLYYSPSPGSTSAHHIPTDAFITKAQAYNIILLRLVRGEEVMPIVWIVCAIEMYPLL